MSPLHLFVTFFLCFIPLEKLSRSAFYPILLVCAMSGCKVGPVGTDTKSQPPHTTHNTWPAHTVPVPGRPVRQQGTKAGSRWKAGRLVMMACKVGGSPAIRVQRGDSRIAKEKQRNTGVDSDAQCLAISAILHQTVSSLLAFGGDNPLVDRHSNKQLHDFYNNTTLTNVSKVFCAIVLLTAFFMVMSKSFNTDYDDPPTMRNESIDPYSLDIFDGRYLSNVFPS